MAKVLDATCAAGIVRISNIPLTDCEILSEGVASSTGIVLIDGEKRYYIPSNHSDLKTTLTKIASALGQVASALTGIDGKPAGDLPPAPVAATQIAQITTLQGELSVLKDALK